MLRRIAAEGPDAFHRGAVAEAIAAEIAAGGASTRRTLAATSRSSCSTRSRTLHRGLSYVTSNDTVGYEALNILEGFPLGDHRAGSAEYLHLMAEATSHALRGLARLVRRPRARASPMAGLAEGVRGLARGGHRPRPRGAAAAGRGRPWPFDPSPVPEAAAPSGQQAGRTALRWSPPPTPGNVAAILHDGSDFGSLIVVPGHGDRAQQLDDELRPTPDTRTRSRRARCPSSRCRRSWRRAPAAACSPWPAPAATDPLRRAAHHGGRRGPRARRAGRDRPAAGALAGGATYVDSLVDPRACRSAWPRWARARGAGDQPRIARLQPVDAVTVDGDGTITTSSGATWHAAAGGL